MMIEGDLSDTDEPVESIRPEELKERIDSDETVFIVDVRSEGNFNEWHIDDENVNSVIYPYFQLLDRIPKDLLVDLPKTQNITVLCAKGGSSETVAEQLSDNDYDIIHLEHRMNGWARIYEYTELDVDVNATVAQSRRPSSGCLAYLVASGDEAAIIDPLRAFTDEYEQDADAFELELGPNNCAASEEVLTN